MEALHLLDGTRGGGLWPGPSPGWDHRWRRRGKVQPTQMLDVGGSDEQQLFCRDGVHPLCPCTPRTQVWTLIANVLKPILRIGDRMAPAKSIVVCEQLVAVCTAHTGRWQGRCRPGVRAVCLPLRLAKMPSQPIECTVVLSNVCLSLCLARCQVSQ